MNIAWRDGEETFHGEMQHEHFMERWRMNITQSFRDVEWTFHGKMEDEHYMEKWSMNIQWRDGD